MIHLNKGFLNLAPISISGKIFLCHRGCPVQYRIFSSISGLLWLHAIPTSCDNQHVSKYCWTSPGDTVTPTWEPLQLSTYSGVTLLSSTWGCYFCIYVCRDLGLPESRDDASFFSLTPFLMHTMNNILGDQYVFVEQVKEQWMDLQPWAWHWDSRKPKSSLYCWFL